ncbi:MAG: bifunctional demethylmenaquinone methyltransferase/2-methoxy-6-polyprenyl-1,4-benzoquinol methylase UbiE [Flavobacteriales bacterium]|nr:bifunctional demethylmenaquinone methyltransferase/2-methoxy-6-polyprenyl-1,4-benzoquinol methylase UbiE [Flavobacteriales bacterium]MBK9194136.1 bifunctional demethylmenaquinone methyltransferase/2-methoxy-6-polyprenyl-1,4-benzoquinol methylase UbiE [Flavobacteriales bacterium]MBP6573997.1 bifunctional demethylmenaquinone methyltransferase/2-methoxy-6-polyprenyl-1,4-benzoquinol methylase UbiE [Flavobacteriales bacterium]
MSITPYSDTASKREQVEHMFDSISPKYDLLNRVLSMGVDQSWRRATIASVAAEPVAHLLDVATGTADMAIMAARRNAAQRITGVDISAGMLDFGRKKVTDAGLTDRITLQQADSEALPFADGTFDAATVAFGARNFEHLAKGLAEMQRVLRPGGRIFVLEFSQARGLLRPLFRFYFHHVMPAIGKLVSKDSAAYTYLPKSVDAFPDGDAFLNVMREVGFKEAAAKRFTGGIATLYSGRK